MDTSTRKWVGILALLAAVPFYVASLLYSPDCEPLLIVFMLALFGVGLYQSSRAVAATPDWEDPFTVRLKGAGHQGSPERKQWLHIQTQRGRSIRQVLLFVLLGALALFVENHVTGSLSYKPPKEEETQGAEATPTPSQGLATPAASPSPATSPTAEGSPAPQGSPAPAETSPPEETSTPETPPSPEASPGTSPASEESSKSEEEEEEKEEEEETTETPLDWVSHADRMEDGRTYQVEAGDNLASIARTHERVPSLLGPANPAAVLKLVEGDPLTNAVKSPDKETTITIQEASRRLQLTPALLATRYATTPLAENQKLNIPAERPYDPQQWVDWLLWALIGMAASLLVEVARHLREVAKGEGDFLSETSWYWTQLATGPLIAFVILLLFVHIDVDLLTGDEAALEVNLREYPTDLLLVPAFLLGFYSRVARELLDQIMRKIFAGAWRAANGDFDIVLKGQDVSDDEVASSSQANFETKPPMLGTLWNATEGTIDGAGLFKPPQVDAPKKVFVTAITPSSNRSAVKSVMVVKHKFQIDAPGNPTGEVHPGMEQKLAITPPLPPGDTSSITWEIVPTDLKDVSFQGQPTFTGANATLTIPEAATAGQTASVKCTVAGLSRTRAFAVKAGLSVSAQAGGTQLAQNAQVPAGTAIDFTAAGLAAAELAQVKWSAEPATAISFTGATTGEKVKGTANATGAVVAEHLQKGKARFEVKV